MCAHRSVVSNSLLSCGLSQPAGSSVHEVLQARILEWVAILSSGDLPDLGVESGSSALQAESLPSEPPGKPVMFLNIVLNYFLLIVFRNT